MIKLLFKKLHEDAVAPKQMLPGDAGYDLTATEKSYDHVNNILTYKTGLAVAIPDGYVGLIFMRSSVYKTGLSLCNAVGVIDSKYRGEISAKFKVNSYSEHQYVVGERIMQMVIVPYVSQEFEEVKELPKTERGASGWGSTNG